MNAWKARSLQVAGALLQVGAAVMFIVAGDEGAPPAAILGAALSIAGLLLWGAGAKERASGGTRKADDDRLEQMEQILLGLHDDMGVLLEERDAARMQYTPIPDDSARLQPPPRQYRNERE